MREHIHDVSCDTSHDVSFPCQATLAKFAEATGFAAECGAHLYQQRANVER